MKWTQDKMDLYLSMRSEGASTDEIAEMLGCSRQAIYGKKNAMKKANRGGGRYAPKYHVTGPERAEIKKGGTNMKNQGKRVRIDPVEFWEMVDSGATRKEIAKHFDISVGTVCNRITAGRPKTAVAMTEVPAEQTREEKFDEIINSIDAGKAETEDKDMNSCEERILNTFLGSGRPAAEKTHESSSVSCDNERHECDNENASCDSYDNAPPTYAQKFAEMAHGIVASAEYNGITPERVHIDIQPGFTCAEVTGADKLGNVCELRLTVMDAPTLSVL